MSRDEKNFKSPFSLFDTQSLLAILSSAFAASQKNQEHLNEMSWESQIWYGGSLWLNVIIFKGYIPNCTLVVEAMLATASLGAIWSSTSPDFGVSVIDKLNYLILKMYSWAST